MTSTYPRPLNHVHKLAVMLGITTLLLVFSSLPTEASMSQTQGGDGPVVDLDVHLGVDNVIQNGQPTPIRVDIQFEDDTEVQPLVVELETYDALFRVVVEEASFTNGGFTWELLTHGQDPWVFVSAFNTEGSLVASADTTASPAIQGVMLGVGTSIFDELAAWLSSGGQLLGTHSATNAEDAEVLLVPAPQILGSVAQLAALPMVILAEADMEDVTEDQRNALRDWIAQGGELVLVTSPETENISNMLPFLTAAAADEDISAALPQNFRYRIGVGSVRVLSSASSTSWHELLEWPALNDHQVSNSLHASVVTQAVDHHFIESNNVSTRVVAVSLVGFLLLIGPLIWAVARFFDRPGLVAAAVAVVGVGTTAAVLTYSAQLYDTRDTYPLTVMDSIGNYGRVESIVPFTDSYSLAVPQSMQLLYDPVTSDRFIDIDAEAPQTWLSVDEDNAFLHSQSDLNQPTSAYIAQPMPNHEPIISIDTVQRDESTLILELTNLTRSVLRDISIYTEGQEFTIDQLHVRRPKQITIQTINARADSSADQTVDMSARQVRVESPTGVTLGRSFTPLPLNSAVIALSGRIDHYEMSLDADQRDESTPTLHNVHGPATVFFRQLEILPVPVELEVIGVSKQFEETSVPSKSSDVDGATAERIHTGNISATYRFVQPAVFAADDNKPILLSCQSPYSIDNIEYFNGETWIGATDIETTGQNTTTWTVQSVTAAGAGYFTVSYESDSFEIEQLGSVMPDCEVNS